MKKSTVLKVIYDILILSNEESFARDNSNEILEKLVEIGLIIPTHINPQFKGKSGRGEVWDHLMYLDECPEHHYTYKNPQPQFYLPGWESEEQSNKEEK